VVTAPFQSGTLLRLNEYDVAKKTARFAKAKGAADDLIKMAFRVQADALDIEARAKRRLADEYDAAQERREINGHGGDRKTDDFKFENSKLENIKPAELHEARIIRDAEKADPGIVRRTVDAAIADEASFVNVFPQKTEGGGGRRRINQTFCLRTFAYGRYFAAFLRGSAGVTDRHFPFAFSASLPNLHSRQLIPSKGPSYAAKSDP
jgi:hypothetical protein